ncbi:CsgG/HfaB family protein [Altibacter sp. HG106]|uniref:CsgG/HfaB family protein n=1 Tax=Altibacter sp. HG106 TaxID=3023937 RepID=UPI002350E15A|nr:CsgG/HfaB family protein [Altibacter sp. HG106]MDC7995801.1 CsgG/HfaB family protein [Altibacter sp. HG106]
MRNFISICLIGLLFTGCGTYLNQPVQVQKARTGELTPKSKVLRELPPPQEPIIVGVYNFKDQTGQYKNVENGSSFSTAVSQGATTMLIKALEDSNWFTPIERENLGNLTQERNIIRSTREEFAKKGNPQPALPPLLFAGILLEGGIVSYDSNIITGGLGARYFGVGGSTQYREDRLTLYLRAVSTSNGKILKTVYVSKTILSQAIDASLFRYVNFQRLLEVETGITKNEPVQLAMKDAIEKAVEALIVEGIEENLWSTGGGAAVNQQLVAEYNKEKELEESTLLYERRQTPVSKKNSFHISGFTTLFQSDFSKKPLSYGASFGYSRRLTDYLGLGLKGSYLTLEAGSSYEEVYVTTDLNIEGFLLPYDDITPFVFAGAGYTVNIDDENDTNIKLEDQYKAQGGLGIDAKISDSFSLRAFAEANFFFSDEIDEVERGKRDDFYYAFGVGLNYHFGKGRSKRTNLSEEELTEPENTLEE